MKKKIIYLLIVLLLVFIFTVFLKGLYKPNLYTPSQISNKNLIEFRRGNAGGGNQFRQPYLKKIIKKINFKNFKEVDHVHFFGYYIGNYPSLKSKKISKICSILNSIKYAY